MGTKKNATDVIMQNAADQEGHAFRPYFIGKPRSNAAEHHASNLAEGHEHGEVDDEIVDHHVPVQTVVKHISGHGIAESVEEIGAHGHACHIQPRFVVHEIDKLV